MKTKEMVDEDMRQMESGDIINKKDVKVNWTAKAKKNAILNYEKDGVKKSVPIMQYISGISSKLPPCQRNGKRLIHSDELKWLFMHGKTKEQSLELMQNYCNEVIEAYKIAIEEYKQQNETK